MASKYTIPNLKTQTDAQLLVMLYNDRMDAFEELYYRYWKKLYGFAYNRVRSTDVAEEIVQDFLTNLWAARNTLIIKGSFEGYIYTAIRNLVLNYIAEENRRVSYNKFVHLFQNDIDNSTEETIFINDLKLNLQREIGYLPSKCRLVFEMSRQQNQSNKEIANKLGISEKTVESHLTKAIKRLRVNLNTLLVFF